jgi:hypothetical protein
MFIPYEGELPSSSPFLSLSAVERKFRVWNIYGIRKNYYDYYVSL